MNCKKKKNILTQHTSHTLYIVWVALYTSIMGLMFIGLRFAMNLGPIFSTNTKYIVIIVKIYHGLFINGHESISSSIHILIFLSYLIIVLYGFRVIFKIYYQSTFQCTSSLRRIILGNILKHKHKLCNYHILFLLLSCPKCIIVIHWKFHLNSFECRWHLTCLLTSKLVGIYNKKKKNYQILP